ncbi:MAG: DUF2520 domain-containing protein [Bacteroidetes bacterium]|nr:DUF2520 domain-containing protein [Bacteroidota bacterium]
MQIVIIGTGNVATLFSRLLRTTNHQVIQVFGRNPTKAAALAAAWGANHCSEWADIVKEADLYLIALSDAALSELQALSLPGKLVVHTAGSVSREILLPVTNRNGVFYHLQSIRRPDLPAAEVPLLLEAASAADENILSRLAIDMGCPWQYCSAEDRKRLHVGAIWVNNFPNLLYAVAYRYCKAEGQDFGLLMPLLRETVHRVAADDPWHWQTGPAVRNDKSTIETHLQLLAAYPEAQVLYKQLSEAIANFNPATE